MANGYAVGDSIGLMGVSVSGVVANSPISREYPITAGGSLHHVVKIEASGVTVVGSITAKLQTAIGTDWVDSKTVAITGNGSFYIKLLAEAAGDQSFLPLLNRGRLVITTTNAGDMATIAAVFRLQED
jgi:hypothetical protein